MKEKLMKAKSNAYVIVTAAPFPVLSVLVLTVTTDLKCILFF